MPRGEKVEIDKYFANIKPYLELGYSMHKSCILGDVPYRTMKDYYDADPEFARKVRRTQNEINAIARKVITKSIRKGDKIDAKWWAERREKADFSLKEVLEHEGEVKTNLSDEQVARIINNRAGGFSSSREK